MAGTLTTNQAKAIGQKANAIRWTETLSPEQIKEFLNKPHDLRRTEVQDQLELIVYKASIVLNEELRRPRNIDTKKAKDISTILGIIHDKTYGKLPSLNISSKGNMFVSLGNTSKEIIKGNEIEAKGYTQHTVVDVKKVEETPEA